MSKEKTPNRVSGEGVLQGVLSVPMTDIVADEKFNARKSYEGETAGSKKDNRGTIEDLAQSIKRDGQLQPVLVQKREKDGKYLLRFGFRRYKALQHLKATTIKVQLWEGEEQDAMLVNLAENCARNDLLPWEIAERCVEISSSFQMSGSEIATRLGKSKAYINNLMRIVQMVEPGILKSWKGGDGRATFDNMVKLAKLTHEEQEELWDKWGGVEEEGEGEAEEGEGEEREPGAKRPGKRQLMAADEALKEATGKSDEWKAGARAVMNFVLGRNRTIPGVYNPDKPEKK